MRVIWAADKHPLPQHLLGPQFCILFPGCLHHSAIIPLPPISISDYRGRHSIASLPSTWMHKFGLWLHKHLMMPHLPTFPGTPGCSSIILSSGIQRSKLQTPNDHRSAISAPQSPAATALHLIGVFNYAKWVYLHYVCIFNSLLVAANLFSFTTASSFCTARWESLKNSRWKAEEHTSIGMRELRSCFISDIWISPRMC